MKYLISLLFLFLIGCSSKDFFISPEYKNKKINDAILYVSSINEFKIRHTENIFSESELTLINKNLVNKINDNLKQNLFSQTTLSKIEFVDLSTKIKLVDNKLTLSDENYISFKLPEEKISFDEKENVFVLFIESFSVSLYKKERETSDPAKQYTISNPTPTETKLSPAKLLDQIMSCEFKYLIWDNNKQKPVYYGYANFESKFEENDDIDKMLTRIVDKISNVVVSNSPFKI